MAVIALERVATHPDQVALQDERSRYTWAQLSEVVNRVANALRAVDLGEHRRVAVYAENSAETVIVHLGALIAGASVVPINFHLTVDEAAYILRDSAARVLLVGPEQCALGVEAADSARVPVVVAWRSPGAPIRWEEWLGAASADDPPVGVAPRPNLMYTSGTTGFPKGADLAPTMFAQTSTIAAHIEALHSNRFTKFGTHLVVGPLYHTGPLNGMRSIAAGVPLVVAGRFDPENTLRLIETHRVETSLMVPTHFKRLLDLDDRVKAAYDVSSVRLITHTGAVCPVPAKHAMIAWFGPVLLDAYGATEVGTICTINSEDWLRRPGSVGRCIPPFVRPLVVDADGRELPTGTEGALFFEDSTGRGVVYPNDAEKSALAHIAPGIFTIGEIGYVDEDGFVYITDRFSDMIVAGGVNIYPAEAEAVIAAHPKVADVAVIGVPDADLGEAVKALVVPRDRDDPPTEAELIACCRDRLAGYKCPRTVDLVASVGRNAMGKISKRALRAPYWEATRTGG